MGAALRRLEDDICRMCWMIRILLSTEFSNCNPMMVDEDAKQDRGPFRFVLASNSLHTKLLNLTNSSERCAQKSCLIGKDIQVIFVDAKKRNHLKCFFRDRGLAEHIQIIDLESLATVATYNQFAKSFFSEIASIKKLTQLN